MKATLVLVAILGLVSFPLAGYSSSFDGFDSDGGSDLSVHVDRVAQELGTMGRHGEIVEDVRERVLALFRQRCLQRVVRGVESGHGRHLSFAALRD